MNHAIFRPLRALAAAALLAGFAGLAQAMVIAPSADFPVPGGRYQSLGGTTFEVPDPQSTAGDTIPVELVSLSLVAKGPSGPIPSLNPGETFSVDSFFDVFTEISVDGGDFQVDSFFDVFVEIDVDGGGGGGIDTEIVSMELSGPENNPSSPLVLRVSPTQPSTGHTTITQQPGSGDFQVDSFFDVFVELSLDDGNSFAPAAEGVRLDLVRIESPEPATAALLALGLAGLGLRRKRR